MTAGSGQALAALVLVLAALPLLLASLYVAVLALAAPAPRPPRPPAPSRARIAVLVPAHDEELLVARCVASLLAQTYPPELRRVLVVADNCSDATAAQARAAGAEVLVRSGGARGKGQALRWAMDRVLAGPQAPDAIGVVDADSVAHPELLARLAARLRASPAVQALYLVLPDGDSPRRRLVALGFELFHRVRLGGRARLGLPAALVGNGMLFASDLLRRVPWNAFSGVEDLEQTLQLRLAGVRPVFAPDAVVLGPIPDGSGETLRQRRRWEGGRLHAARAWLPRLLLTALRRRDPGLLDAALDLAVPPLSLLVAGTSAGLLVATAAAGVGIAAPWAVTGWLAGLLLIAVFVGVGARRAGAGTLEVAVLLLREVPAFLLLKLVAYAALARGFDPGEWSRTRRPGEAGAGRRRAVIGGVPIDPLTMEEARSALRTAMGSRRLHQVATINMDFLSSSQRSQELRSLFSRTALNLADGAPVVWLGRLTGQRLPERVAGADLVPAIAGDASAAGAGIFLLGGENGAAQGAAEALVRMHPGLRISGVHEPPRSSLEEMDSAGIVRRVAESGADILLVALGHPKQDLWIDRHRAVLPVSIAIGVGCVFDLLAGRTSRAPRWMQRTGLEWLYRVLREPSRLAGRYTANLRWLLVIASRALYLRLHADRQVA